MTRAATYYRENSDERNAWSEAHTRCWLCGKGASWLELQTHEMHTRARCRNAWALECNYFRVCNDCHEQRIPLMSLAEQLAVKLLRDPQTHCVEPLRELASQVTGRETMLVYDWEILEAVRQRVLQGGVYQ